VIVTDCIGSCKSNYHTITVTTAPIYMVVYCVDYSTKYVRLKFYLGRLYKFLFTQDWKNMNYTQGKDLLSINQELPTHPEHVGIVLLNHVMSVSCFIDRCLLSFIFRSLYRLYFY